MQGPSCEKVFKKKFFFFIELIGSLGADDSSDSSQLLTPRTPRRRRSSVMFSDVIVEHRGADANVCWNEKTTQTDARRPSESSAQPGRESATPSAAASPVQRGPSLKRRASQRRKAAGDEALAPAAGAGLTCQELLALSGALGAALPTPLALPSYPDGAATPINDPPAAPSNSTPALKATSGQPGAMPILALSLWPEPFAGNKSARLALTGTGA